MSEGFTVDHDALAGFSGRLRAARQRLEEVGASTPPTPDGGSCGPLIADLLVHLTADAGRLSSQLAAATDQIDHSNNTYRSADQTSQEAFRAIPGPI